jgi:hypothetical protein
MSESRAAGWPSDAPTAAQLKELFAQIDSGRIKKSDLQRFLRQSREVEAADPTLFYRNLTGYTIKMLDDEEEIRLIMPPEEGPAAEVEEQTPNGWTTEFFNGFTAPVLQPNRTVLNTPPPRQGTFLIVLEEVAEACLAAGLPVDDLLIPDRIISHSQVDDELVFTQFRCL